MTGDFTIFPFLTDNRFRQAIFLTFLIFVPAPFHSLFAADTITSPDPIIPNWGAQRASTMATDDVHRRLGVLLDYVRKEGPSWAPGLPHALRDSESWALNGMHEIGDALGLSSSDDNEENTIFSPLSSLIHAPTAEEMQALWFSPTYHHKGFLPLNDAMILGVNLRHGLFDNRVRMEIHPYYGQNWLSQRGYWGSELSANFNAKLGPIEGGKISLGYVNGDSALMDSGHGFDLHSELRFTNHLSLDAGVRQNEETELGNYVLLRWKLVDY